MALCVYRLRACYFCPAVRCRRPMRLGGGLGGDSRLPKEPRKKLLADAAARGIALPAATDERPRIIRYSEPWVSAAAWRVRCAHCMQAVLHWLWRDGVMRQVGLGSSGSGSTTASLSVSSPCIACWTRRTNTLHAFEQHLHGSDGMGGWVPSSRRLGKKDGLD